MNIEELEELSMICKSIYVIDELEDAINKGHWIKISTPYIDADKGAICGGELGDIFRKHLRLAITEMNEYIENLKIEGLENEIK